MNWWVKNRLELALYVVVFIIFVGAGILINKFFFSEDNSINILERQPKNFVFMATDSREGEFNTRTDTIIFASIDKNHKDIVMVWIPRDTRVASSGHYAKINSINYSEGSKAVCEKIEELLGVRVDYYAVTNFAGFEKIVDVLGGVEIDVETDMYHPDPDPRMQIDLHAGLQTLNGEDALRYVRYRGGTTADIGRTERQQKFIKALAREILKPDNLTKLPELVTELKRNIRTNIPVKEIANLVNVAGNFEEQSLITQTLPGFPYTDPTTGASYWIADEEIADGIIKDLREGQKYEPLQTPPAWAYPQNLVKVEKIDPTGEESESEPDSTAIEDVGEASTGENQAVDGTTQPEQQNPWELPDQGTDTELEVIEEDSSLENQLPEDSSDIKPGIDSQPEDNAVVNESQQNDSKLTDSAQGSN